MGRCMYISLLGPGDGTFGWEATLVDLVARHASFENDGAMLGLEVVVGEVCCRSTSFGIGGNPLGPEVIVEEADWTFSLNESG